MKTLDLSTLPAHEQAARQARAANEHRHLPAPAPAPTPERRPEFASKLPDRSGVPEYEHSDCRPQVPDGEHFTRLFHQPIH